MSLRVKTTKSLSVTSSVYGVLAVVSLLDTTIFSILYFDKLRA